MAIASQFCDTTLGLGRLDVADSLADAGDPRALLVDTIREACVNETISAAQCQAAGDAAQDPFIRETLRAIAEDEQRHAALAWATVRWLLSTHPELRPAAIEAFDDALGAEWRSGGPPSADLTPWGVLSADAEATVAARVIRRVIRPCVDALLHPESRVATAPE